MLLQIRDFIQREKMVNIQQLQREFMIAENALKPMLDIWIRKGMIEECTENHCSRVCGGCFKKISVHYKYLENTVKN